MQKQQEQLKQLRDKQAAIRDKQRERMDIIHSFCHEYLRNVERKNLGREIEDKSQDDMIKSIHQISHDFMWILIMQF